jgi:hypothetical protein
VAADSKLVVSLIVGKRTSDQTLAVVHDAHDRLRRGHVQAIFTDAFASDESAAVGGVRSSLSRAKGGAVVRSYAGVRAWPMGK